MTTDDEAESSSAPAIRTSSAGRRLERPSEPRAAPAFLLADSEAADEGEPRWSAAERRSRLRKFPPAAWATGDVLASRSRRCWTAAVVRGTASSGFASARIEGSRCRPPTAVVKGLANADDEEWATGAGRAIGESSASAESGVAGRYESVESSDEVEAERSSAGTSNALGGGPEEANERELLRMGRATAGERGEQYSTTEGAGERGGKG